jgi:protein SCO1/2
MSRAGALSLTLLVTMAWAATPDSVSAGSPTELSMAYRLVPWPAGAQSPSFTLQDANGRRRTLADFRGRIVVIFFGFLHCPDACPTELFKLAQVLHDLGPLKTPPQILFITLDPQRDTPQQLTSYVTHFNPTFVGLTGSADQIQRAADSFGVQFARVSQGADYTIDHSTATYVFDAQGRLRFVGALSSTESDMLHDLKALLAEQPL